MAERRPMGSGLQSPRASEARSEEAQRVMIEEMRRQSIPEEDRRAARRDMMREPLSEDEVSRVSRGYKKGGRVKCMASGGKVRGDGICRVKTRGRMV